MNKNSRQPSTVSCQLFAFFSYLKFGAIFLIFISVLFLISCAYSFKSGSFDGTLSIASLENNTQNADIGRILTEDLIDAFIVDDRVKVETDLSGDYLLEGIVNNYKRTAESYTPEGEVEEYRISVKAKFSLKRQGKEKNEWEKNISESFIYPSGGVEIEAVDSVAVKIRDSLLRLMLETW
jgi:outer membrane lipopolysaccharide assembly protein LptE/RlpB